MTSRLLLVAAVCVASSMVCAGCGSGDGQIGPRHVSVCLGSRVVLRRSLIPLHGREVAPLSGLVGLAGRRGDLNGTQVQQAREIVRASAVGPNGHLHAVLDGTKWSITDISPLASGSRTFGAAVSIKLWNATAADVAVPALYPIPSDQVRRFLAWRSLGYLVACQRLKSPGLIDLSVQVDLRHPAQRIVEIGPGPDSPTDSLTPLPDQGPLPRYTDTGFD